MLLRIGHLLGQSLERVLQCLWQVGLLQLGNSGEGLLGSGSIKVAANWVVTGAARWDLEANKLNQYVVGAGYVDDCFVLAANYVTSYQYSAGTTPPTLSHAFMFQIGLRTLATTSSTGSGAGIK